MPGTATAGRLSFFPFAYSSAATGHATNNGIPLFQAFSPISVQGSTYSDCIKDGRKIDPACGSGNFLTETYISLRKLENEVLKKINRGQQQLGAVINPIKVSIQQMYGIEVNDFAVSVAQTALWIAEHKMFKATEEILDMHLDFLPLKTFNHIHEGNALRIDWNSIVSARKLNYINRNLHSVGVECDY